MKTLNRKMRQLMRSRRGAAAGEYVVVSAVLVAAIATGLSQLDWDIIFGSVNTAITSNL